MNIGKIAQLANLPASTIRYYESINLLPQPARRHGRRVYQADVLERLNLIRVAKQAGWTLHEIKQIIDSNAQGGHFSDQWRKMAQQKLAELDQLIVQAEAMKEMIHQGLDCHCTSSADCQMLQTPLLID